MRLSRCGCGGTQPQFHRCVLKCRRVLQPSPKIAKLSERLEMLKNAVRMKIFEIGEPQVQGATISNRQLNFSAEAGQRFFEVIPLHPHGAAFADRLRVRKCTVRPPAEVAQKRTAKT